MFDPPAWELGELLTTPHRQNVSSYELFTKKAYRPEMKLVYNLNNGKRHEIWYSEC